MTAQTPVQALTAVDAEAEAALAAVPPHLRREKPTPTRQGSTRLVFSDRATRSTTPDTRKARP